MPANVLDREGFVRTLTENELAELAEQASHAAAMVRTAILASDTSLVPAKMFGPRGDGVELTLEVVEKLISDVSAKLAEVSHTS